MFTLSPPFPHHFSSPLDRLYTRGYSMLCCVVLCTFLCRALVFFVLFVRWSWWGCFLSLTIFCHALHFLYLFLCLQSHFLPISLSVLMLLPIWVIPSHAGGIRTSLPLLAFSTPLLCCTIQGYAILCLRCNRGCVGPSPAPPKNFFSRQELLSFSAFLALSLLLIFFLSVLVISLFRVIASHTQQNGAHFVETKQNTKKGMKGVHDGLWSFLFATKGILRAIGFAVKMVCCHTRLVCEWLELLVLDMLHYVLPPVLINMPSTKKPLPDVARDYLPGIVNARCIITHEPPCCNFSVFLPHWFLALLFLVEWCGVVMSVWLGTVEGHRQSRAFINSPYFEFLHQGKPFHSSMAKPCSCHFWLLLTPHFSA